MSLKQDNVVADTIKAEYQVPPSYTHYVSSLSVVSSLSLDQWRGSLPDYVNR